MTARIFQFPTLPRRVPVGPNFTVEESATAYRDVREIFANAIVHRNRPWWERVLSDHTCDDGE